MATKITSYNPCKNDPYGASSMPIYQVNDVEREGDSSSHRERERAVVKRQGGLRKKYPQPQRNLDSKCVLYMTILYSSHVM